MGALQETDEDQGYKKPNVFLRFLPHMSRVADDTKLLIEHLFVVILPMEMTHS